jgi:hypothetical protein
MKNNLNNSFIFVFSLMNVAMFSHAIFVLDRSPWWFAMCVFLMVIFASFIRWEIKNER